MTDQTDQSTSTSTRTRRPSSARRPRDPRPDAGKPLSGPQTASAASGSDHTGQAGKTPEARNRQANRGGCAECAERDRVTVGVVAQLAAEVDDTNQRQWRALGACLGVAVAAVGIALAALLAARRAGGTASDDD